MAKRRSTKNVVHALVTRRSEPDRIVDRRGEDNSCTANRRDRRNHEHAINDAAESLASRRPLSNRVTNQRDDRNSTAMHLRDDDELEIRRDGDIAGHRQDGGPIAAMPTLAVIIVNDTEGGKELLILLTRTYYLYAKNIIYKQLYNYVEIHVVITSFYVFMVLCAADIIW